ncbi:glycosyltransferase family 2 protein [Roseobacter sp.]|uniref:glycosyltransferase family 2 protein n=1 Tax=Roseobacter sp. TaxID=1907202 RepID=UPI0025E8B8BB|nr:glycosyltransferase family 2 protein [Roseobacter sp.]
MNDLDLSLTRPGRAPTGSRHPPLGQLLVDTGKIGPRDLMHALGLQGHIDAPLGDIMVAEGLVSRRDVLGALAQQARSEGADLELSPPAPDMAGHLPAALCLRYGVVPWREDARALYVATPSPTAFASLRQALGSRSRKMFPVIVDEVQIQSHISRLYGRELAGKAAVRVPATESCRGWSTGSTRRTFIALGLLAVTCTAAFLAPAWTLTAAVLWAVITLAMITTLKAAAFLTHFTTARSTPTAAIISTPFRLPRVSVLVPLLKEKEIAAQLIARLSGLTYPKSLLNVVLVLEEDDRLTRETIARTELPEWMSVIEVPGAGDLTTKPRALNYALDFCRGSIVGVWDAEDWPEADQIERVVSRFNDAPPEVVCLQGVLDYYNSRANWLARCFTIEYATWWRMVMPGLARLGLVLPLGGTTLFFRRDALEELGGWDAHNVTEDADLGVRLARHGYRTELIDTVTHEEATSRAWPWIRQRSRWLKGFMITYFVHMRRPRQLIRDVGFIRFMGLQTIFLAAFSQFAMAPVLWTFWLSAAGMPHPVAGTLGSAAVWSMAGLFIFSEVLSLAMGLVAVSGRGHRHLMAFVPTMMFYYPLGTVAAYKALWEMLRSPFFWDKTQHGVTRQTDLP